MLLTRANAELLQSLYVSQTDQVKQIGDAISSLDRWIIITDANSSIAGNEASGTQTKIQPT